MYNEIMKFSAILLMGGKGERFKSSTPKQLLRLGDFAVYEHALFTLVRSGFFDEIVIVSEPMQLEKGVSVPLEIMDEGGSILSVDQLILVEGGATRQESSHNGLLACSQDTDYVVIHDAVRPFLNDDILERNVESVMKYGAINTCIPTFDAINRVNGTESQEIFSRGGCMLGQTPQSFAYGLILEAHKKTKQTNATDDCSLVLEMGHPVRVVMGDQENFKITTPLDLEFARTLLESV